MPQDNIPVGKAISAALDRAEELRRMTDRPARIRIMTIFGDDRSGLTINARISPKSPAEHRAQNGLGTRCIPWDELDARASELVSLVDEVVGEVTLAVKSTPPSPRPSRTQSDHEIEIFDHLIDELCGTLTRAAMATLEAHESKHLSKDLGSEATMLAALKLAALAAFTANVGISDLQDELRLAVGDVMAKMSNSFESVSPSSLNS